MRCRVDQGDAARRSVRAAVALGLLGENLEDAGRAAFGATGDFFDAVRRVDEGAEKFFESRRIVVADRLREPRVAADRTIR